jgi:hypothetical protein
MDELVWGDVAARIVPLLRPAIHGTSGAALLRTPIVPLVFAYCVMESAEALRYLDASDATRLGRPFREILSRAVLNVANRPIRLEPLSDLEEGPPFRVVAEDGFATTRVLLPGWLQSLRDHVEGEPVCAMPERGCCFVAGDASIDAMERVLEAAERAWAQSDEGISPVLYTTHGDDSIVPLELPEGHPLAPKLQRAHALFTAHEYEEQGAAIDADIDREGGELVVGSCRVVPDPSSGGAYTATTFVEGVDALLPVTDLVFVAWQADGEPKYLLVRSEDLADLAAKRLLLLPDYDPPRVATIGFPDARELAELRARALATGAGPS